MNDALTRLYQVTGDSAHLRTAQRLDHENLYTPLAARRDELAGRHANTEIAKVVGAVPGYEATGDSRYLDVADTFWTTVVRHHSYAIGGNSNQELFGPPDEIVSRLFGCCRPTRPAAAQQTPSPPRWTYQPARTRSTRHCAFWAANLSDGPYGPELRSACSPS